jgi:hypothetical protein
MEVGGEKERHFLFSTPGNGSKNSKMVVFIF